MTKVYLNTVLSFTFLYKLHDTEHVLYCMYIVAAYECTYMHMSVYFSILYIHTITKYSSTLYIGMGEVFQHHAHTFEKFNLNFHFQCEIHILAPPSMRHSSQRTFQESLGNMTTNVAAATQPTAGGNIGITSSTCMV